VAVSGLRGGEWGGGRTWWRQAAGRYQAVRSGANGDRREAESAGQNRLKGSVTSRRYASGSGWA
jgi:hypothetical protein